MTRYVVIGAGAVGGSTAAELHLAGRQVLLIARGRHLELVRERGLDYIRAQMPEAAPKAPANPALGAFGVVRPDGAAGQPTSGVFGWIALQQASELRLVPSVKFAGLLPEAVQNWTVYTGALSPAARSKDAALTLMSALSDPGMEPMLKRRGLESP